MDDDKFQLIIKTKYNLCFRKDECMLFSAKHEGIENCMGPFQDCEDYSKKIKEDSEKETKQKADLEKAKREVITSSYFRKRKLFDDR